MFGSTFLSIFLLCIAPVFGIFKSVLLTYMWIAAKRSLNKNRFWQGQLYFPQGTLSTHLADCSGVSLPSPVLRWPISIFQNPCLKSKFSGGKSQYFKSLFIKKKVSGAAAAWDANAGMGGRLQLWNHVKLLSRTALWPGDHKDSLKHFFTALTCIHRGICFQYVTHHELC